MEFSVVKGARHVANGEWRGEAWSPLHVVALRQSKSVAFARKATWRGEAMWQQGRCLLIGDCRCYHLSHKFYSGDRQRTPATPATPLIGDFVGTYMLIFAGCAAIILNINKVNVVTLPGIAPVWGLVVMVLIYSGAHFNTAVTIAFATSPGECLTSPACTGECNIIEPAKALISETNPPKYKSFSYTEYLKIFFTDTSEFEAAQPI
ncbi:Nodulin-26 [Capsicum baccatum]|uniref:Nodulin-26 n=1 Tax=Capsicum baccatum TaxID=33114 RepID=A0A2G2WMP0_CAPBA|nr:Nodulin-26 [Capsicum baccatum]